MNSFVSIAPSTRLFLAGFISSFVSVSVSAALNAAAEGRASVEVGAITFFATFHHFFELYLTSHIKSSTMAVVDVSGFSCRYI